MNQYDKLSSLLFLILFNFFQLVPEFVDTKQILELRCFEKYFFGFIFINWLEDSFQGWLGWKSEHYLYAKPFSMWGQN